MISAGKPHSRLRFPVEDSDVHSRAGTAFTAGANDGKEFA